MKIIKYLSAFCLILIFSNFHAAQADTGIDGTATSSSSFSITGLVSISSLTVNNLSVSGNIVSSGTIIGGITISSSGIVGVTNGSDACAGCVGERISSYTSNVSPPTSGNWGDLTSISLTPGDWDVSYVLASHTGGTVNTSNGVMAGGIGSASGNNTLGLVYGDNYVQQAPVTSFNDASLSIASYRMSLTTTTTVYAKMLLIYTSGPIGFYGRLSARRVR